MGVVDFGAEWAILSEEPRTGYGAVDPLGLQSTWRADSPKYS